MSLSESRWNASPSASSSNKKNDKEKTLNPKHPIQIQRQQNQNQRRIQSSSSKSQDIIIRPGDRLVSKKFAPNNQTNTDQSSSSTSLTNGTGSKSSSSQLNGIINSFNDSVSLKPNSQSIDVKMSLVPSPSRGLDNDPKLSKSSSKDQSSNFLSELDLTDFEFQIKFLNWVLTKVENHRKRFKESKKVFMSELNLMTETDFDNKNNIGSGSSSSSKRNDCDRERKIIEEQRESAKNLMREIKKLREGIVSSKRKDWASILVYELSSELALESLDLIQLNSFLPNLIKNLYNEFDFKHQLRLQEDFLKSNSDCDKKLENDQSDFDNGQIESYLNKNQREKDQPNKRRLFKMIYLLLPLLSSTSTSSSSNNHCNSMNFREFLTNFEEFKSIFNLKKTKRANSEVEIEEIEDEQMILNYSFKIFRYLKRSNQIKLNKVLDQYYLFSKSKNSKLERSAETSSDETIDDNPDHSWDLLVLLKLLKSFRTRFLLPQPTSTPINSPSTNNKINQNGNLTIKDNLNRSILLKKIYNNTLKLDDYYLIKVLNFDNELYLKLIKPQTIRILGLNLRGQDFKDDDDWDRNEASKDNWDDEDYDEKEVDDEREKKIQCIFQIWIKQID